jgi:hypothetical protein
MAETTANWQFQSQLSSSACSRFGGIEMPRRTRPGLLIAVYPLGVTFGAQDIHPPLQTSGQEILDAAGHRVRLTSVNMCRMTHQFS